MSFQEFAKYTSQLNSAAKSAAQRLISMHYAEYDKYLAERMAAMGYVRNTKSEGQQWIRTEQYYGQ